MRFDFEDGELQLKQKDNNISIQSLCDEIGEPFYIYDIEGMLHRFEVFNQAFSCNMKPHYAVKANNKAEILQAFAAKGIGADVVSGGEIEEALAAGFAAKDIIFSGVGKTKEEIKKAIEYGIKQINIESPSELKRVAQISEQMKKTISVAFRLNPDVSPETHPYITTGFRDNKFGMDVSFLPELKRILSASKYIQLKGLTLHIGSQIREIEPMLEAIKKTLFVFRDLKAEGFDLHTFDVGGGLGINYNKYDLEEDEKVIQRYGREISQLLSSENCEVLTEPGRVIVARFGLLLGEVQYIKETPYKKFAILNTGMHHLMRPCLYQAHHEILKVKSQTNKSQVYDVVGPICESSDVLGYERLLPELNEGDWLAIADVGAYGAVMASQYNSHAKIKEVIL